MKAYFVRAILAFIVLLSFSAAKAPIKRKCLKKLDTIAGKEIAGGTDFDWTDEAVEEFNTETVPVLKRSCFAPDGELNSFRMVVRGTDDRSNLLTESAGPSEYGDCKNERTPVEAFPLAARIFYDARRVQGVEFLFKETTDTFLIGNKAAEQVRAIFNETHSWIGFYGTQGTDRINTLGFVVLDKPCSEPYPDPIIEEPVDVEVKSKEEEELNILMIAIVGGGALFVILIFTITCCCYCSKNKRSKDGQTFDKIVTTKVVVFDADEEPGSELELLPPPHTIPPVAT